MKAFNDYLKEEVTTIKVGALVKIIPHANNPKNSKEFIKKYKNKIGKIKSVDYVEGKKGYEVFVFDLVTRIVLDYDEVVELKGSQLKSAINAYE